MKYITFKKLEAVSNPDTPTAEADSFIPGEVNPDVSVPAEYTVTGFLKSSVAVGSSIEIYRDSRNGIKVDGIMLTSVVTNIELKENGLIINTKNSVYDLTWNERLKDGNS